MGRLITSLLVRLVVWVAAVVLALIVIVAGVVAAIVGGLSGAGIGGGVACDPAAKGPAGLTGEQACNAATIVGVGQSMSVPERGHVIAIATALQESGLRNLPGGDRDSVGLFQQRPSQGWGSVEQLLDPVYASRAFYRRLLAVPDWERKPLAEAAQAVQRSADGSLYARHETRAAAVVAACGRHECGTPAAAWVRPAPGVVGSGFRTADRPGHDGIDIMAPRGTTIRAASAGRIVTVVCNSSSGTCDRDGSPSTTGCGWYVDLRSAGDVTTRYCHMLRRPTVRVGQLVTTGQAIGLVGSSGNSSGPHLHFQAHHGYPATESNATDPAAFLRAKGVRI